MNDRNIPNEVLDKVIGYLLGTCYSLEVVLSEFGYHETDMAPADYAYIEEDIFCCSGCGWWCEVCEMADDGNGEQLCEDCVEQDEN